MTTAKDIAKYLGVATSTVGRALADDPRISLPTKKLVREAAEALGYVGNDIARMMRGMPAKIMGLLLPDVSNDFYAAIAQSLSRTLDARGYRLVLFLTGDDPEVEARQIRELVMMRASMAIMVPTSEPLPALTELARNLPVVQLLRNVPHLGKAWFGMDDASALATATRHVIARGHRRVAYVGGSALLSTGRLRVEGVRSAFEEAGRPRGDLVEALGAPTAEFGRLAASAILEMADPPTALIAGSAHITSGIIMALENAQVDVPKDMSVIGFGNAPWQSWWRGGLTAIEPPVSVMAAACGEWCIEHLEAPDSNAPRSVTIPSAFNQRLTVANLVTA